jgi:hypothetical protein
LIPGSGDADTRGITEKQCSEAEAIRLAIESERSSMMAERSHLRGCKLSKALRRRAELHVQTQLAVGARLVARSRSGPLPSPVVTRFVSTMGPSDFCSGRRSPLRVRRCAMVASHRVPEQISPVPHSPLPCVLPPATPVESINACVAHFSIDGGLPRYLWRVGSHDGHFEARPVFTHVAARTARWFP